MPPCPRTGRCLSQTQGRGKAMAQCVRRHPLLDLGHGGGGMNGTIELPRRHRQHRIAAGEQPDRRPGDAIPVAQQLQQLWGEHRVAILAPLTLLDPQQMALGVDIRHLQRYY